MFPLPHDAAVKSRAERMPNRTLPNRVKDILLAMPTLAPEVYTSMGLRESEFELILKLIGREPTLTELGMFAVMWSEHCGYKYSRPVLRRFKNYQEAIDGAGLENAGVVPIGNGLAVTMKVESHNHPSAVEPYQGAATGVGGIIRDILTMGARPIAGLNSLRFGTIGGDRESPEIVKRNRYLMEHVVGGIAGYGNCVGVPTVAGEVDFDPRYSGNPLVNAMCVGLLNLDEITTAAARGVGNSVVYLGSATGKDGIHGATFASEDLSEDNAAKRPNVQIGDPFAEKTLIEATLEALQTGAIVAIQDMGAAGLTCSTVEMAEKGRVGLEVDLDLVPMRESDMTAYELMLSESQERMMAVVTKGREEEVLGVFRKWGLPAAVIGTVSDGNLLKVYRSGKLEAALDPLWLTEACPTYSPEAVQPEKVKNAPLFNPNGLAKVEPKAALLQLLSTPALASKEWVYEQFDRQVQTQTVLSSGQADAAVLKIRGLETGISVSLSCNHRWVEMNPRVGGQLAVLKATRRIACTGAKPVALTDGLNFGSPEIPEVFWTFRESVYGIAEAAEHLQTPVISGNVSLYNRSELGAIPPSPMIGAVGIMESASNALPNHTFAECELVLLSTKTQRSSQNGLGASAFLWYVHGIEDGSPEAPDFAAENHLNQLLVELAGGKLVQFATGVYEGGLACALAKLVLNSHGFGVSIAQSALPHSDSVEGLLFGEWSGRVIVGVNKSKASVIQELADNYQIGYHQLGSVDTSDRLAIGTHLTVSKSELMGVWNRGIGQHFE